MFKIQDHKFIQFEMREKKKQEANNIFCFTVPLAVGCHDRNTRCDRQCCWKILFCAVALARKLVPVSRAALFLQNEGILSKYLHIHSSYIRATIW